jgi:predicted dienelactone hydrolase
LLVVVGLVSLLTLFGYLLWRHCSDTELPLPTGPFAVGRTTAVWRDESRSDPYAAKPGEKRELAVWIWYPAEVSASAKRAEYVPLLVLSARNDYAGVLLSKFMDVDRSRVRNRSLADVALATARSAFPVVILKSGLGAYATDYTVIAENLASHGYVVVANDSPYTTSVVVLENGRVIRQTKEGHPASEFSPPDKLQLQRLIQVWTADTRFMLDQLARLNAADPAGRFTKRLDLDAVGVMGHSFGGATALQFCHDDARCKAGVDLDGMPFGSVVSEGAKCPLLILSGDHAGESTADIAQIEGELRSIFEYSARGCLWLRVNGARHFNFSDQALIKPGFLARAAGAIGPADVTRIFAVTNAYVLAFFERNLQRRPVALLDEPSLAFPEVKFIARQE